MAAVPYPGTRGNPVVTANHAVALTTSDDNDLTYLARALHISVGGTLKVTMASGSTCEFAYVPAGVMPIQVARVWATGTAATGIVALY